MVEWFFNDESNLKCISSNINTTYLNFNINCNYVNEQKYLLYFNYSMSHLSYLFTYF